MHKLVRNEEPVPSTVYDEKYYLSACSDYDLFQATRGLILSKLLEGPFRLACVQPGQNILDIGCGRGELLVQAARIGANVYGIDYSEAAIRLCLENREQSKPHLRGEYHAKRMDAKELAFADGFFDTVFMIEIIEHLHNWEQEKILAEVVRVLKKGSGKLIVHTCPNRWFLDIGYPYYTRWINWIAQGVAKRFLREYDLDSELPTRRDVRSDYKRMMHVNEQTYPQLTRMLERFFPRVTVMPIFFLHTRNPAFRLYDLAARWYPISKSWPLHLIFADGYCAVAEKR